MRMAKAYHRMIARPSSSTVVPQSKASRMRSGCLGICKTRVEVFPKITERQLGGTVSPLSRDSQRHRSTSDGCMVMVGASRRTLCRLISGSILLRCKGLIRLEKGGLCG
jgi:hypothetical protein